MERAVSMADDREPGQKRSVAVFHGALDPITDSILIIAEEILSKGHAREVWLVPTPDAPSKVTKMQRLAMCHLAIESKVMSAIPIYVRDADNNETQGDIMAVLRSLQGMHPAAEFFLVCGSEQISSIRSWRGGDRLWNEGQWLVIPRASSPEPAALPPKAVFLASTVENSPEELRIRLQHDPTHGAEGLIPLPVWSFIRRYGLYGVPSLHPQGLGRRIAVMGGSFSPPTVGHTQMAADLLHSRLTDEVLMVPCGPRPDKPSLDVAAEHRYIMCELAVADTVSADFPIRVECLEIMLPRALSSYELGKALRERNPGNLYQMVFGADLYEESKGWDDGKLWEENDFLWVPRVESPLPVDGPEKGKLVVPPKEILAHRIAHEALAKDLMPCTSLETSSSNIREQYREGNLLAASIGAGSRSVFSYWQRYGLYTSK